MHVIAKLHKQLPTPLTTTHECQKLYFSSCHLLKIKNTRVCQKIRAIWQLFPFFGYLIYFTSSCTFISEEAELHLFNVNFQTHFCIFFVSKFMVLKWKNTEVYKKAVDLKRYLKISHSLKHPLSSLSSSHTLAWLGGDCISNIRDIRKYIFEMSGGAVDVQLCLLERSSVQCKKAYTRQWVQIGVSKENLISKK